MEQLVEESINNRYSYRVREALDEVAHSFTITDPTIPGHPIVFASTQLLKMYGYSRDEVIGKNSSIMFQGIHTNRDIRHAVRDETTVLIPSLLTYHKNGTPFSILFLMFPVFGKEEDGKLIHFVALQLPIIPRPRSDNTPLLGFCRREVSRISILSYDDDNTELSDAACKANDLKKRGANSAMTNILALLIHYSQLTGRLVSDQRCYMSPVGVSLNTSLGRIKQSFVLVDPHKTDIPIVYVSDAFLELTGYTRHEVLGRNCRFLSGQDTDVSTQLQITDSIQIGKSCNTCILSYRKDGSSFWNALHMSPVRNASGKIAYIAEVHMEVKHENQNLSVEIRQLSVVGAVKIAVRSSGMIASTSDS